MQTTLELTPATEDSATFLPVADDPNDLLVDWNQTQTTLKTLKQREAMLRAQVVKRFFGELRTGTNRVELGKGYTLKAVQTEDYKLCNANGEVEKALADFSDELAELLVRWEPKLSVSNYKALAPEYQAMFNDCLEIKPCTPQLEIEAPKLKR